MIFRNDDVCFGMNVNWYRQIRSVFEKYNLKEMYSVVPVGKVFYVGDPFRMSEEELANKIGDEFLLDDKDAVEFIKESLERGHSISLHGWKHTIITREPDQADKIKYYKNMLEYYFKTEIAYFVPPFNFCDAETERACDEAGLVLLGPSQNQLEWAVGGKVEIYGNIPYCWYHAWRFFMDGLTPEKLDNYLRRHYG